MLRKTCRPPETFNSAMHSAAQGADGIYAAKSRPLFGIFYYFPPRCPGVFPLQTGVCAALVSIHALVKRDSLCLGPKRSTFLF